MCGMEKKNKRAIAQEPTQTVTGKATKAQLQAPMLHRTSHIKTRLTHTQEISNLRGYTLTKQENTNIVQDCSNQPT